MAIMFLIGHWLVIAMIALIGISLFPLVGWYPHGNRDVFNGTAPLYFTPYTYRYRDENNPLDEQYVE